jgi:hypothetical protein
MRVDLCWLWCVKTRARVCILFLDSSVLRPFNLSFLSSENKLFLF